MWTPSRESSSRSSGARWHPPGSRRSPSSCAAGAPSGRSVRGSRAAQPRRRSPGRRGRGGGDSGGGGIASLDPPARPRRSQTPSSRGASRPLRRAGSQRAPPLLLLQGPPLPHLSSPTSPRPCCPTPNPVPSQTLPRMLPRCAPAGRGTQERRPENRRRAVWEWVDSARGSASPARVTPLFIRLSQPPSLPFFLPPSFHSSILGALEGTPSFLATCSKPVELVTAQKQGRNYCYEELRSSQTPCLS